jgi:anti-sigma-K factor RskA
MSQTEPQNQPDEALLDLLVKQVTEGLSPAEQRELDVLDSASASRYLREFERAAAAVALAGTARTQPPPAALTERLEAQALDFLNRPSKRAAPRVFGWQGAAGWLAAAACLILAVFGWLRSPELQPTPAQARAALLARSESVKLDMSATKDPAAAGVSGDVVWDPVTQQGFLRFVGLPPNDPKVHQYQLWIFDATRDQRYPVDGGVFDIPGNSSEVLIPIHARLPVRSAKAFAVTLEKSGGVVVSEREHVLVLAQAG